MAPWDSKKKIVQKDNFLCGIVLCVLGYLTSLAPTTKGLNLHVSVPSHHTSKNVPMFSSCTLSYSTCLVENITKSMAPALS